MFESKRRVAPTTKMALGMVLTGFSFIIAGFVQKQIDAFSVFEGDSLECIDGCVSLLWQLPQYVVMTAGEILFSIPGLELVYSQSPVRLKSVMQGFWLLSIAFGNLIVVLMAEWTFFTPEYEFYVYSIFIFMAMLLFVFVVKWVEPNETSNPSPE
jgi:dipeptide/tripeptide permease